MVRAEIELVRMGPNCESVAIDVFIRRNFEREKVFEHEFTRPEKQSFDVPEGEYEMDVLAEPKVVPRPVWLLTKTYSIRVREGASSSLRVSLSKFILTNIERPKLVMIG
jgi:hypothetical protein